MTILRPFCTCGERLERHPGQCSLTVIRHRWRPWKWSWAVLFRHEEHTGRHVITHGPLLDYLMGSLLLEPHALDRVVKLEAAR